METINREEAALRKKEELEQRVIDRAAQEEQRVEELKVAQKALTDLQTA